MRSLGLGIPSLQGAGLRDLEDLGFRVYLNPRSFTEEQAFVGVGPRLYLL